MANWFLTDKRRAAPAHHDDDAWRGKATSLAFGIMAVTAMGAGSVVGRLIGDALEFDSGRAGAIGAIGGAIVIMVMMWLSHSSESDPGTR